ncbi:MAG TPA: carboxypeptidase regulatory-like domain-containing protein [Planctomycetota bacterium]|nr:carboxypeptidase regulatory-like domain-containing protein [Planctomycetota bacterium]
MGGTRTRTPGDRKKTLLVQGRLVARDGGPPPADALVSIRTDDPEIDFPEVAARLGGRRALLEAFGSEGMNEWQEETGGIRPAIGGTARSDGSFSIPLPPHLPKFRVEVEADFAFAEPSERFALSSPEVESGLTVVVSRAGKVEGSVRGLDGNPLSGARVVLGRVPRSGSDSRVSRCDAGGSFVLRGLPPGKYLAAAVSEGFAPAVRTGIGVHAREVARVDFGLGSESSIRGRVVDDAGHGVPGARVRAWATDDSLNPLDDAPVPYGRAVTDAEGSFRIGSLGPGEHFVTAAAEGLVPSQGFDVDVPGAGVVEGIEIVLEAGRALGGKVVGWDGKPVAGARIAASMDYTATRRKYGDRSVRWTREPVCTSEDGSFRIAGLGEAVFVVVASHPEQGAAGLSGVETGRENLLLTLQSRGGVAGSVREAQGGAPVRAFTVAVEIVGSSWAVGVVVPFDFPARAVESEDGSFELIGMPPGRIGLRLSAQGFVDERVLDIEVKSGEVTRGVEVQLRRAGSIRGKVVEKGAGAPVPGAEVGWFPDGVEPRREWFRGKAVSGSDGSFALTGVEPGKVRLRGSGEDLLAAKAGPFEVRAGETLEGIVLAISRGGGVDGYAIAPDGFSYAGAGAEADPIGPGDIGKAEVGEGGYFRVAGLPAGRYFVRVYPPSSAEIEDMREHHRRTLRGVVRVEVGRIARVQFAEPPKGGCTVKGRVLRGKEGVADASLSLVPNWVDESAEATDLYRDRWETETGVDGSYRLERVPAGEATLRVVDRADLAFPLRVPEASEFVLDVPLPSGAIEGRILRASDRSPLVDAFVSVSRPGPPEAPVAGTRAGVDGRYRIGDLSPGAYLLGVGPPTPSQPEGATLAPEIGRRVEVGEGGPSVVDFLLAPGGSARVLVRDPEGQPASNVNVFLVPAASDRVPAFLLSGGQTGGDGLARIAGIVPGVYVVGVHASDYGVSPSEEKRVRAGEETEFRVDLVRGTTVWFRFVGADGGRVDFPRVDLRDAQGRTIWPSFERGSETDLDASVTVRAVLCPGEYRLKAGARGYRERDVPVRVEPGVPQEIEVRLEHAEPPK